jgi:hypothetical protein
MRKHHQGAKREGTNKEWNSKTMADGARPSESFGDILIPRAVRLSSWPGTYRPVVTGNGSANGLFLHRTIFFLNEAKQFVEIGFVMTEATHPGVGMMQPGSSFAKTVSLVFTALAITLLSFGPMFWMSRTPVDRYIILCASLPLSGVCFAWAWRERRRFMLRWAACMFAGAFSLWLFFLFYFLFVSQDEMRGLVLVAANLLTNGILFAMLNRVGKKKDHSDPLTEMAVI